MNSETQQAKQEQAPQSPSNQENDRDRIIAELIRANSVLKANISTLYRTARAEIARKNGRISELQSDLDDLLFKRMKSGASQGSSGGKSYSSASNRSHNNDGECSENASCNINPKNGDVN